MSYAVCNYFCTRTDNQSSARHYPSRTTGCCTNLLLSRLPWEPTVLPWRLQGFTPWFETQPQPCCLFEDTVIHNYLINTQLYLTFSIYGDKLLVVKFNKYPKIHIFQHCFLFIFFAGICGLINNLKTFNGHALMLLGTFIDM